nr:VOC family protein [uncultured Chryseobacterium sp.]
MQQNKIQLSHVLYRVEELHLAVRKLRDAGFVIEYGTDPVDAYNAFIWFENGVFIEIYHNSGLPFYIKWMMKVFGYRPILDRMKQWEKVGQGWCEWALESTMENLNSEKEFFKKENLPFRFHKAKRKDVDENILKWDLLMPDDIDFPFFMSAYVPNPKPKEINHPNGIKGVKNILVGTDSLNISMLNQLLPDQSGLQLIPGKGLQTVELMGSDLRIEDILKR